MSEIKHTPTYEVTHDGRVFSVDSNWRGYGRREMTQMLNADGYPCVRIIVNGKRKRVTVFAGRTNASRSAACARP